jgi:hypothetical protein
VLVVAGQRPALADRVQRGARDGHPAVHRDHERIQPESEQYQSHTRPHPVCPGEFDQRSADRSEDTRADQASGAGRPPERELSRHRHPDERRPTQGGRAEVTQPPAAQVSERDTSDDHDPHEYHTSHSGTTTTIT